MLRVWFSVCLVVMTLCIAKGQTIQEWQSASWTNVFQAGADTIVTGSDGIVYEMKHGFNGTVRKHHGNGADAWTIDVGRFYSSDAYWYLHEPTNTLFLVSVDSSFPKAVAVDTATGLIRYSVLSYISGFGAGTFIGVTSDGRLCIFQHGSTSQPGKLTTFSSLGTVQSKVTIPALGGNSILKTVQTSDGKIVVHISATGARRLAILDLNLGVLTFSASYSTSSQPIRYPRTIVAPKDSSILVSFVDPVGQHIEWLSPNGTTLQTSASFPISNAGSNNELYRDLEGNQIAYSWKDFSNYGAHFIDRTTGQVTSQVNYMGNPSSAGVMAMTNDYTLIPTTGQIRKYDRLTGAFLASIATPWPEANGDFYPTEPNRFTYAASNRSSLGRLDATTSGFAWSYNTGATYRRADPMRAIALSNGVLVVQNGWRRYDAQGNVLWNMPGDYVEMVHNVDTYAVDEANDAFYYIEAQQFKVRKRKLSDGSLVWDHNAQTLYLNLTAGVLRIVEASGNVRKLNLATGASISQSNWAGTGFRSACVAPDGTMFVLSNLVTRFSPGFLIESTGSPVLALWLNVAMRFSASNRIYVYGTTGPIAVLNAANGAHLSTFDPSTIGISLSSFNFVVNDDLFIAYNSGPTSVGWICRDLLANLTKWNRLSADRRKEDRSVAGADVLGNRMYVAVDSTNPYFFRIDAATGQIIEQARASWIANCAFSTLDGTTIYVASADSPMPGHDVNQLTKYVVQTNRKRK